MQISSEETELIGRWGLIDGQVRADSVCTRIDDLTHSYLKKLAATESGWETLYRDPIDHRLWELTYPQSEMHGGGPPTLRVLALQQAKSKYGV